MNVEIIEMELMPDHVHLLLEVDPQFGIHKAVKPDQRTFFPDTPPGVQRTPHEAANPLDQLLFLCPP